MCWGTSACCRLAPPLSAGAEPFLRVITCWVVRDIPGLYSVLGAEGHQQMSERSKVTSTVTCKVNKRTSDLKNHRPHQEPGRAGCPRLLTV